MGLLYGKYDLLDRLTAYRVRPAPSEPPGKFETGHGTVQIQSRRLRVRSLVMFPVLRVEMGSSMRA
jgi:hypothetical protein